MIGRYLRALIGALRMTLRGEKMVPLPPGFASWWQQTQTLVASTEAAARAHNVDMQTLKVRVEGRETSMATILSTVRFHAATEYPHLLRREEQYGMLAMQATNYNDRFLIMKLAQDDRLPEAVRVSLEQLSAHLEQPPKNDSSA